MPTPPDLTGIGHKRNVVLILAMPLTATVLVALGLGALAARGGDKRSAGYLDFPSDRTHVRALRLVTVEATYGSGERLQRFGVALRSVAAQRSGAAR